MSPSGSSLPKLSFTSLQTNEQRTATIQAMAALLNLLLWCLYLTVAMSDNCHNSEVQKTCEWYLHVFSGHLVKAVCQLSHQILIPTNQQSADLL